jgi:hypothetical protein
MLDRSAARPDAADARTSNSQSRCSAASRAVHRVADAPGTVLHELVGGSNPAGRDNKESQRDRLAPAGR